MLNTTIQNRYRIEAELGRGGMGVVYRAYDTLLDRAVAVKVLSHVLSGVEGDSGLGTEGRARLLREAQAAAKLDHPNIVSVYDAGETGPVPSDGTGGTPFIVMQLVSGASLRDIGPLSIPQIITVARQLCDALDHAHEQGIVHRDLKPENVVVVGSGERLIAKLMDFGLALSPSASRLTQEGALVGTVFYLAPEQALGQPVDGRADLYALGVVLYELTTGRLPFTGDDPLLIISQHLHAPVEPPRAHNPAIPPDLESLILRLLSKQPEDRPASAREVLDALTPSQAQSHLPSGNITFLFTDIEGSTPLWERDPSGMQESLARHDAILHEAIAAHGGQVFKVIGDAFQAAFVNPTQAVRAALAAQRALAVATWGATGPLRVRMGLHTGPAEARGADYAASHTLNRVARVASAAHSGQILLSLAVAEHLSGEINLRDLGKHRLKGLSQAEHLFQIVADDLPSDFPPLNSTPVTPPTGGEVSSLLDRIVRGRLVGREAELAEEAALWQKAVAGEGQVLLVSGEPGVGKTRLVRELMTQTQASGAIVLVGECYAEGGAPYAPIGQIIRQALDTPGWEYPAGSRLALPDFVLADLITLAPGLRARYPGIPPNPSLDPQSEQERIYESVIELCIRLAQTTLSPLLLVVDDAHWADSGTLFLLRHLARRLRRGRAMIVATYREVELEEARPLHEVLLDLNRERLAVRLKLSRLSREQTRDLLTAMFAEETTPEFLEGIYHETEGNPFFVEEVCKALVESGQLYFADGRWRRPPDMADMEIPQSVRVAIQSRVSKLPAPAQEALLLAAILGREFDFETLLTAGDSDEDKLIEALETAARAQLVEELRGKSGEVYAFVHALIPTTLRESVSGRRRRRLHQRVAKAIERLRPNDDEALAHHFAAADDSEKAIEYSRRAARRAENLHAYDAAIQHLRAALDFVEASEQPGLRRELLEQLADVHSFIHEGQQAIPLYQEAIDGWRLLPAQGVAIAAVDADPARLPLIRLHRKIIQAVTRLHRWADVQRCEPATRASAEAGLKLVEGQPPQAETIFLLTTLSREAWLSRSPQDWGLAEHYARAAVDMAEQLGAPVELSDALNALASVYGARGLFREQVQVELRRLALSQDARFTNTRERVSILYQVGAALVYVGEYVQAMPHLLEAERLAGQIQGLDQQLTTLRVQSHCLYQMDRWDQVIEIEEKWRALEKQYPNLFRLVWAGCFQVALNASVHARRGNFERAAVLREQSLALMKDSAGSLENWGRDNHY